MGISLIGISHHNTPLAVRELFAFPAEKQQELMRMQLLIQQQKLQKKRKNKVIFPESYNFNNDDSGRL